MEKAIVKAVACISIAAMVIGMVIKGEADAGLVALFSLIAISIIATQNKGSN